VSQTPILGRCACGALSYQANAAPTFSIHCQCRQCQRSTGGGHASLFRVPASDVVVTGQARFFDQRADSGNTVSRGFCPQCGSPVLVRTTKWPDDLFFHAASLDDPTGFRPERVVHRHAAQPWDHIDPDLD
jgi:hypothetical protein